MLTRKFVRACKDERDALLALYRNLHSGSAVGAHLDAAGLSSRQRAEVLKALDVALSDSFYLLLSGIAGSGSLGGSQQIYRLLDEQSRPISPAGDEDLEALAFELFMSDT